MQIWLKNVAQAWAAAVGSLSAPAELALWQATGDRAWKAAKPGDLLLFRPEGRHRSIIGHGRYFATTVHRARDAYGLFGATLGVDGLDALWDQIATRRSQVPGADPVLGTVLIRNPVLFPVDRPFELPWPFDAFDTGVPLCTHGSMRGKTLLDGLRHHARPVPGFGDATRRATSGGAKRVNPLGRPSLRSVVMRLYGHRCAVTGERVSAVTDIIHFRPRKKGGADALGNLAPLRTDFHRLVDRGLMAFDEDHRVIFSAAMDLFEGTSYLAWHGAPLRARLFGDPWPDEANLRWLRAQLKMPRYEP